MTSISARSRARTRWAIWGARLRCFATTPLRARASNPRRRRIVTRNCGARTNREPDPAFREETAHVQEGLTVEITQLGQTSARLTRVSADARSRRSKPEMPRARRIGTSSLSAAPPRPWPDPSATLPTRRRPLPARSRMRKPSPTRRRPRWASSRAVWRRSARSSR